MTSSCLKLIGLGGMCQNLKTKISHNCLSIWANDSSTGSLQRTCSIKPLSLKTIRQCACTHIQVFKVVVC
uniref:Uncharacterized protein n=2 Tax=Rhizophora mucronata TaxID=61149 RepID=A0A2P2J5K9_RHIMU